MQGFSNKAHEQMAQATAVASEAIGDVRTVAALTNERLITSRYELSLRRPSQLAVTRAWVIGALTGFSQALLFATYTLNFW